MNKKRKIAFVGNDAVSMMNFRLGVMKALTQEYEVVMVTPHNCDLSPLEGTSIRFISIEVDRKGTNPFEDYRLYRTLKALYRTEQFDFIFHFTIKPNIYGSLAASALRIRHIDVVTGLGYTFIRRNWLFRISCLLHRFSLRHAQTVWFLNQDDCDAFMSLHLVRPDKTLIIPGEGVNTDFYHALSPLPDTFTFIYAGRMLRYKGVELFVQAAKTLQKEYPNVRWQLLGPLDADDPERITSTAMENYVQHGWVEYLGVFKDVRPYIERSSCSVLASYFREGIPRALLEAAAMERPIIATNTVGCKDVVVDGVNGLLCEKKSLDSLVQAMRRMIEMPREQLVAMGKAGRERMIAHFDERIIIDIYKKVLNAYA